MLPSFLGNVDLNDPSRPVDPQDLNRRIRAEFGSLSSETRELFTRSPPAPSLVVGSAAYAAADNRVRLYYGVFKSTLSHRQASAKVGDAVIPPLNSLIEVTDALVSIFHPFILFGFI